MAGLSSIPVGIETFLMTGIRIETWIGVGIGKLFYMICSEFTELCSINRLYFYKILMYMNKIAELELKLVNLPEL